MPEPTTATRLGARPPDFAAIGRQGVLYILADVQTTNRGQREGTSKPSFL